MKNNTYTKLLLISTTLCLACAYNEPAFTPTTHTIIQNCDTGKHWCNEKCVQLDDPQHCGKCNNPCTIACEKNPDTETYACGCGQQCTSQETCVKIKELSPTEINQLDNPPTNPDDAICICYDQNGHITDLLTDDNNCGICGYACLEQLFCKNGTCVCDENSNLTKCNPNAALCEINTQSDTQHCGQCNHKCDDNSVCTDGHCCPIKTREDWHDENSTFPEDNEQNAKLLGFNFATSKCHYQCREGFDDCNGDNDGSDADGCETNIAYDPDHCGQCGHQCPQYPYAITECQNGTCHYQCDEGFDNYGSKTKPNCRDTTSFQMRWLTYDSNATIIIGTNSIVNAYNFYCNDYISETQFNIPYFICQFRRPGIHTIAIRGYLPSVIFLCESNEPNTLLSIEQWGDIQWENLDSMAYQCHQLQINATDTPDLRKTTSMRSMFKGATNFNSDISDWDVRNVTQMQDMFRDATHFNSDISNWNVQNVTNHKNMFLGCNIEEHHKPHFP